MNTYQPKAKEIKREWHIVDANGKILGRMSSNIVKFLMGKHKPLYAPHLDMGDFVVVINADKVEISGKKEKQKVYYKHSGYPGGFKEIKYSKLKEEQPEKIVQLAVKRMLPSNRLKDKRMARLKVVAGEKNPYEGKFRKTEELKS